MAKSKPDVVDPALEEVDLLGQLRVTLDGVDYILRPSRQAISNIEVKVGRKRGLSGPLSLTHLATQCGSLALSVDEMAIAVAEMMNAYAVFDPEASADYRGANAERCADLIYEAGPIDVARPLAVIFTAAMTGGYTASGEVKRTGTKMTMEPTPTAE